MDFPDLFKLEKLRIEAFADSKRYQSKGTFEAMFNPETFDRSYENKYDTENGAGSGKQTAEFVRSLSTSLTLKLVLDGTNVEELGVSTLSGKLETVKDRVDRFLELTYYVYAEKEKTEPYYLVVRWGELLAFSCRLSRVKIIYKSFDRNGTPLRAELELTLVSDEDPQHQSTVSSLASPDVSHSRVVTAGDTLPLLTRDIYGTSAHYLAVARANRLDHFRSIEPGQEILFPPIAK